MSKHGLGGHYHRAFARVCYGSKRREERVRDARRVILFEKTAELFLTILAEAWVVLILNILLYLRWWLRSGSWREVIRGIGSVNVLETVRKRLSALKKGH
jgi:hypothetical protein